MISETALSTAEKAPAACVTTPNSTSPRIYIGATITTGSTSAR